MYIAAIRIVQYVLRTPLPLVAISQFYWRSSFPPSIPGPNINYSCSRVKQIYFPPMQNGPRQIFGPSGGLVVVVVVFCILSVEVALLHKWILCTSCGIGAQLVHQLVTQLQDVLPHLNLKNASQLRILRCSTAINKQACKPRSYANLTLMLML